MLQQLLFVSLAMKAKVLGAEVAAQHAEEHRAAFWRKVDSKLCHVNVSAALEMKEWREFIQSL